MTRSRTCSVSLRAISGALFALSLLALAVVPLVTAGPALAFGGGDWSTLTSPTTDTLYGVTFSSGWKGWAVGDNGTIINTIDGTNWALQNSGTSEILRDVDCLSDSLAWTCGGDGSAVIRITTDGGASWDAQAPGVAETLRAIDFSDGSTWGYGWAVGDNGTILRTTDFGDHWTTQSSGTTASLQGVQAMSDTAGVACGAGGKVLWTTDGGANWYPAVSHTSAMLTDMSYGGGTVAAVGEGGVIVRSFDGGVTWKRFTTYIAGDQLLGVFVDGSTYYICGGNGPNGVLYISHNAGASWYRAVDSGPALFDVAVPFATVPGPTGWAVGSGGTILQTTDGGGVDVTGPYMTGTRSTTVVYHRYATLRFRADEPDDTAVMVLITIRKLSGRFVKTVPVGLRRTNAALSRSFHCTLPVARIATSSPAAIPRATCRCTAPQRA